MIRYDLRIFLPSNLTSKKSLCQKESDIFLFLPFCPSSLLGNQLPAPLAGADGLEHLLSLGISVSICLTGAWNFVRLFFCMKVQPTGILILFFFQKSYHFSTKNQELIKSCNNLGLSFLFC